MRLNHLIEDSLEKVSHYKISFGSDFSKASRFVTEASKVTPILVTQSIGGNAVVQAHSIDDFQLLELEEIASKYGVTVQEAGPAETRVREQIKQEKIRNAEKYSKMILDAKKKDMKDGKGGDDVEEATLPKPKSVPDSKNAGEEPDGAPNSEAKEPKAKMPSDSNPESIDSVPNSQSKSLPKPQKPADNKPGKPPKPVTVDGKAEQRKGTEIQPSEMYPKIDGFDGPFQFANGQILYWDFAESKYWDKNTDKHLNNDELPMIEESSPWCGADLVVEHSDGTSTQLTQDQHDRLYAIWQHSEGLNRDDFVESILANRSSLLMTMVR